MNRLNNYLFKIDVQWCWKNKALLIELITLKENMFHTTKKDKKAWNWYNMYRNISLIIQIEVYQKPSK